MVQRHGVFVYCNETERNTVYEAARVARFERAISVWARSVLLRKADATLGEPLEGKKKKPEKVDRAGIDEGPRSKETTVFVNCTETEYAQIKAAADASGQVVSTWARDVLINESNRILKEG